MPASDDLLAGLHELGEARPLYERAWAYWANTVPEQFDSPVWQRLLARSQGRYRVPTAAKTPVVALADRMRVARMVALTVDGSERDEEADPVLQGRVWDDNKLPLQLASLIPKLLVFGDSYWQVWPGPEERPGTCTVTYNSPLTTRAFYEDDDQIKAAFFVRSFVKRGSTHAQLIYPDHIERDWVLKDGVEADDPKGWERVQQFDPAGEKVDGEYAWPDDWGRTPVFHFRTDLPHGRPEAEDAWGAQDAINKLSAALAHSSERAGLRDRYLLTAPNSALNGNGLDNPDWEDDEDGDESNRDDVRVRTGPGEIAAYNGVTAAGEWSAADPIGFTSAADWYDAQAAKLMRTPRRYADPGGQHPAGSALKAADAPFSAKARTRQDFVTDELETAGSFALARCGWPDRKVEVRWEPAGIVDDLETWQIATAKRDLGVPAQVAITEAGVHDPEQVQAWFRDSQIEMDIARRVGLLAELAGAVTQLGQGVALGLMDEGMAREIVTLTVGQLTPQVEGDVPA